jgi:hypothetical protein
MDRSLSPSVSPFPFWFVVNKFIVATLPGFRSLFLIAVWVFLDVFCLEWCITDLSRSVYLPEVRRGDDVRKRGAWVHTGEDQ